MMISALLGLVLVLIAQNVGGDRLGKGSFCIGTNLKEGCDNELTNLICFEGKCLCPEGAGERMSSAGLQSNLNTRWHEAHHKCYATKGYMCDLHPIKKRVDCQPGVKCIPDPNNPAAGTCAASTLAALPILVLLPYLLF